MYVYIYIHIYIHTYPIQSLCSMKMCNMSVLEVVKPAVTEKSPSSSAL